MFARHIVVLYAVESFLIAHIREVPSSLDALPRFSVQGRENRRKSFRQLSSGANRVALEDELQHIMRFAL